MKSWTGFFLKVTAAAMVFSAGTAVAVETKKTKTMEELYVHVIPELRLPELDLTGTGCIADARALEKTADDPSASETEKVRCLEKAAAGYYQGRLYDEAIRICQRIIADYPDADQDALARSQLLIGRCYGKQKQFLEERKAYETTGKKYPFAGADILAGSRLWTAHSYYAEKRYTEAKEICEKIFETYPGAGENVLAESRLLLGNCYFKLELLKEATAVYQELIEDYPTADNKILSRTQLQLGNILGLQHHEKETLSNLGKTLFYPSDEVDILAKARIKLGQMPAEKKLTTWAEEEGRILEDYPAADRYLLTRSQLELGEYWYKDTKEKDCEKSLNALKKAYCLGAELERTVMQYVFGALNEKNGGSPARSIQFIKYQRFGRNGADGKPGTKDDLDDPMAGMEGLGIDYVLKRGELLGIERPERPAANWRDVLDHYQRALQETPSDEFVRLENILDQLMIAFRAADMNMLRARKFLEQEEQSAEGKKRELIRDRIAVVVDFEGCLKTLSLVCQDLENTEIRQRFNRYLRGKQGFQKGDFLTEVGGIYLSKKKPEKAKELFLAVLEPPYDSEPDIPTIVKVVKGLRVSYLQQGKATEIPGVWQGMIARQPETAEGKILFEGIVQALKEEEDGEGAENFCRFCLQHYPDADIAVSALNNLVPSRPLFERVVSDCPKTRVGREAELKLIVLDYDQGRYPEVVAGALALLEHRLTPEQTRTVLDRLAGAYEKLEKYEEAVAAREELIRLAGDEKEAIGVLDSLDRLGGRGDDRDKRFQVYRDVGEKHLPDSPVIAALVLEEIGDAAAAEKRFEDAVGYYKKAISRLDPSGWVVPDGRIDTYPSGEIPVRFWKRYLGGVRTGNEEEVKYFREFSAAYPAAAESLQAHYALAGYYLERGDAGTAEKELAPLRRDFSGEKAVGVLAAGIDSAVRKDKEREAEIEALKTKLAAATVPEASARLHYQIGECYRRRKDFKNAVAEWEEIVDRYPETEIAPPALDGIASIYGDNLSDLKKMRQSYRKLLVCFPEHELAFKALLKLKRFEKQGANGGSDPEEGEVRGAGAEEDEYAKAAADYERGDYQRVVQAGWPLWRRMIRRSPGQTGEEAFAARVAVNRYAARKALGEIKGFEEVLTDDDTRQRMKANSYFQFSLVLYRQLSALRKDDGFQFAGGSEPEKAFLTGLERSMVFVDRDQILPAYGKLVESHPGDETVKKLGSLVAVYPALTISGEEIREEATDYCRNRYGKELLLPLANLGRVIDRYDLVVGTYQAATGVFTSGEEGITMWEGLAEAFLKLEKNAQAIEAYENIIGRYPENKRAAAAERKIIDIYAEKWKAYDNAITECRKLIAKYPASPEAIEARFLIGQFAYLNKRYDLAVEELEKFIDAYPRNELGIGARLLIAMSYLGEQKNDEAIKKLRLLVEKYPDHQYAPKAQYLIGYCYLIQQQYEEARTEYEKLVTDYPNNEFSGKARDYLDKLKSVGKKTN